MEPRDDETWTAASRSSRMPSLQRNYETRTRMIKVTGDVRPGGEFRLQRKASSLADATFIALLDGSARVTRRLTDLFGLPDETTVLANWHGQYRTDTFKLTIGELRRLARDED